MLRARSVAKLIVRQRNNMKRRRGQALVEFVIVLPVFIMLVLGVIDMGRILYSKIILEEKISDVISLYERGKSVADINQELDDIVLEVKEENDYINYSLIQEIDIVTPGLNFVFSNPYNLKVSRSTPNE